MRPRRTLVIAAVLLVSGSSVALAAAKDCSFEAVENHQMWGVEDHQFEIAELRPIGPGKTAGVEGYRFEIVEVGPLGPGKTAVDIAILRVRDATPMTKAVVVRSAASIMSSDKSRTVARVTNVVSGRPGIYRFEIDTTVGGAWVLELSATVPVSSPIERTFIPTAKYMSTRTLPGGATLVSGTVAFCVR